MSEQRCRRMVFLEGDRFTQIASRDLEGRVSRLWKFHGGPQQEAPTAALLRREAGLERLLPCRF
jgi:hypothetical protein